MDKKRLIGETEHEITQGEKDGWERGKKDSGSSERLKALTALTPQDAIRFIKMYADLGDIHYLITRFDITMGDAKRALAAFDIHSIEDAKRVVREGIIAEHEDAAAATREADETQRIADHAVAQARLEKQQKALDATQKPKTAEEVDETLLKRQDEAQLKNKQDQIRQLIADGIDPVTKTSDFRIALNNIAEFKRMIPHGVSQLQRRFGGSPKDIVSEIKRISPNTYIDMLRP